jgi:hypothetical protein
VRRHRSCSCSRVYNRRYETPTRLTNILGYLFLGYCQTPTLSTESDEITCQHQRSSYFKVVYCFPQWFLSRALFLTANSSLAGIDKITLEVRRKIAWGYTYNILRFARRGHEETIRLLLRSGKASLLDIDPYHGRTALHVS